MTKTRRCLYCAQPLPRELRADAMYCPGSRCRVYAHRRRKQLGEWSPSRMPVPLQMVHAVTGERPAKRLFAALQRKRKHAKLAPLLQDSYLQAQAEELAFEEMSKRLDKLEREARSRRFKHWGTSYWGREEHVLSNVAKLKLDSDAKYIGLYVIPHELGGGVVLCTARQR